MSIHTQITITDADVNGGKFTPKVLVVGIDGKFIEFIHARIQWQGGTQQFLGTMKPYLDSGGTVLSNTLSQGFLQAHTGTNNVGILTPTPNDGSYPMQKGLPLRLQWNGDVWQPSIGGTGVIDLWYDITI